MDPAGAAPHPVAGPSTRACAPEVDAAEAAGWATRGTLSGGRADDDGGGTWAGEFAIEVVWDEAAEEPSGFGAPREDPALAIVEDTAADAVWLEVWAFPGPGRWVERETVMDGMRRWWRAGGSADAERAQRKALQMARFEVGEAMAAAIVGAAAGLDGLEVDAATGGVRLRGPVLALRELTGRGVVLRSVTQATDDCGLDPVSGLADNGGSVDGVEVADLLQAQHLYDDGAFGTEVRYLVVEEHSDAVHRRHPGFFDDVGNRRYFNCEAAMPLTCCVDPTQAGCSEPDPTALMGVGQHATAVASVLLGDVSLGQHAAVNGQTPAAFARSGVARRAVGWGVVNGEQSRQSALALAAEIDLVNRSSSIDQSTCFGDSAFDQHVNDFYAAGIGWFNSSGNDGGLGGACTIGDGAAAIGSMSVTQTNYSGGQLKVLSNASHGGDGLRTVADFTAPTPVSLPYPHYQLPQHHALPGLPPTWHYYGSDWEKNLMIGEPGAGAGDANGTFSASSAATPLVAGAAGVFMDWYRANEGSEIDEPGLLYALMLVMADGAYNTAAVNADGFPTPGSPRMKTGYDVYWGAGTPRLRRFDLSGMDNPAGWGKGSVCVPHGGTVTLPVNPNPVSGVNDPLPADVDMVRGATWLFDDQHDLTGQLDDVDLRLERLDTTSGTWVVAQDGSDFMRDLGTDNKRRVYHREVQPEKYRIRLHGTNVAGWPWDGCGWNENRVYVAFYFEDADREPMDAPTCLVPE